MSLDELRPRRFTVITVICWVFLALVRTGMESTLFAQTPDQVGQWSAVMPWPLVGFPVHVLPNGKVLVWSRDNPTLHPQVWDPDANTFTPVPNNSTDMFCTGHAFMADGRLLVCGGHVVDGTGLPHTNIFDSTNNTWTRVADMNNGRWYPTTTALANGEMLVVSGSIVSGTNNDLPQVWQTSGGWRDLTSAHLSLSLYPFLHLAPNGKVFNSGPSQTTRYLDTSGTGTWSTVALQNFNFRDYGSSVLYDDGKVVTMGGHDPPTRTAEVIDLNQPTPAWRVISSMAFARRQINATVLPDGKVLVTGGTSSGGFNDATGSVFAAEMWDPATETWTTMASMAVRRLYHSCAVLLVDGRMLSSGGGQPAATGGDADHKDAEIYSPPYLFKGPRPTIASSPTSVTYGETFFLGTPDALTITKVNWIRLSSVTHAFNMNQRINRLAFVAAPGGLNATAPSSSNLCPPGHYILFILDGSGVPSVGKIIQITSPVPPPPPPPIAAPTKLSATAVSGAQINLAWTDNSTGEDGFKIERSRDQITWTQRATTGPNVTSFQNTGLRRNTLYYYRVRAFLGTNNSSYSNVASARTLWK